MAIPFLSEAVGVLTSGTLGFIIFELVVFFISALFIWIGAKVANVEKGSIARSFLIAVILAILTPLLLLPFAGFRIVSLVLSVIINLAIIKIVFSTGWKKSLITWVFSIIAGVVSAFILAFVLVLLV